jgi:hypothetical protein
MSAPGDREGADVEALAAAIASALIDRGPSGRLWARGHDNLNLTAQHLAHAVIAAGWVPQSVVEQREAEVREQIARDIEATGKVCSDAHGSECIGGIAYRDAARIARAGGEQR